MRPSYSNTSKLPILLLLWGIFLYCFYVDASIVDLLVNNPNSILLFSSSLIKSNFFRIYKRASLLAYGYFFDTYRSASSYSTLSSYLSIILAIALELCAILSLNHLCLDANYSKKICLKSEGIIIKSLIFPSYSFISVDAIAVYSYSSIPVYNISIPSHSFFPRHPIRNLERVGHRNPRLV